MLWGQGNETKGSRAIREIPVTNRKKMLDAVSASSSGNLFRQEARNIVWGDLNTDLEDME